MTIYSFKFLLFFFFGCSIQMEALVKEMQDPENGVPVRSQKLFLTSIPSAFMGKIHNKNKLRISHI